MRCSVARTATIKAGMSLTPAPDAIISRSHSFIWFPLTLLPISRIQVMCTGYTSPATSSFDSSRSSSIDPRRRSRYCVPTPPPPYSPCFNHLHYPYSPSASYTPRLVPTNPPSSIPSSAKSKHTYFGDYNSYRTSSPPRRLHHTHSYHPGHSSMPYPARRPHSAPAPPPPPYWSLNVFYKRGTLVWYAGSVWRCDSPHTSGSLAREVSATYQLAQLQC